MSKPKETPLEVLLEIATIAHCGGICGMTSDEALNHIRRLTINQWDKNANPQHVSSVMAKVKKESSF